MSYPIFSITRIPGAIREERLKVSSGEFSELCALDFYKRYAKLATFRHKANASENGIDVWAYSDRNIFFHESKNYHNNGYTLDNPQMTKKWIWSHILNGFQTILKDQYDRARCGDVGKAIEDSIREHMQKVYFMLVKDRYKPLVHNAFEEEYRKTTGEILKLKAAPDSLEKIEEILDYSVVVGYGNSIYHSPLPLINHLELEFEISPPLIPTYFFARDLKKRIL